MKTSQEGVDLIKKWEGCRLKAYQDIRGIWTIGYGETGPYVYEGLVYKQDMAEMGLLRRLADEFEPAVETAGLATQNQFDAMVSLAWNIGAAAFKSSSVCRLHRKEDYVGAASAFALWNKVVGVANKGLTNRRAEEAALYSRGLVIKAIPPAPSYDHYLCAKSIQAALQKAGLYKGAVDGSWGPKSRAAYQEFDEG